MSTSGIVMSDTGSKYETSLSVGIPGASKWERVLEADPQRLFVRIMNSAGDDAVTSLWVLPGPLLAAMPSPGGHNTPMESKWKDCPSVTAGEWYAFSADGSTCIIIESRYTR